LFNAWLTVAKCPKALSFNEKPLFSPRAFRYTEEKIITFAAAKK
jgi:hypothetical protein